MFEQLADVYKGKRVFLTGHTGFKGAWLLKALSLLGATVKGYSLSPQVDNNLYGVIGGDSLCASVIEDLRNRHRLAREIVDFQPDYVFHLAAQPLVRLSYEIPSETFEVNAIGTANLLDGVRLLKKPCHVVLITTDKVYHNNEWVYPYRENDRLGGYDPYSASKACAELVIDSYRNSFFNPDRYSEHCKSIAVARAGNVIGGGDWAKDRLIPDIVRSLSKGETITIRNPDSIRPWQHVLEPLSGYLLLGAKIAEAPSAFSEAYNFGPDVNDALPVTKMVGMAIASWGSGDYQVKKTDGQLHEAGLLKLDISKAVSALQWKPRMDAAEAVRWTIEWYKNFYADRESAAEYTGHQIMQFWKG